MSERSEAEGGVTKVTLTSDEGFAAIINRFMAQNFILR